MTFDYQSVQRLGFDEYATNVAVNIKEDQLLYDGYRFENDKYFVSVSKLKDNHTVTVRAYVDKLGWQSSEIVL